MSKTTTEEPTLPPQFKSWDRTNATGRVAAAGVMSMSIGKNGAFTLSEALTEALKLKAGAAVSFHFDGAKEEWYLERDDKNGLVLRKDSQERMVFNSSALYHAMKAQFPDDVESGRVKLAEEPTRISARLFYALLMSSMKSGRSKSNA